MSSTDANALAGTRDPRPGLLSAPMSMGQWLAVGITLLISATDGYDILAASLAAPSITKVWGLSHERLGLILAVNLVGLARGRCSSPRMPPPTGGGSPDGVRRGW